MKPMDLVRKIISSIYKRTHSWGVFLPLAALYLTSIGLKSEMILFLFGRLGLMTIHVFFGFFLFIIFVVLGHKFFVSSGFFKRNKKAGRNKKQLSIFPEKNHTFNYYVDVAFFIVLFFMCCLGLIYYFYKAYSVQSTIMSLTTISLFHTVVGWMFLSLAFVKYYLTFIHWLREVFAYLRE